jgi:hypothetical protein
MIMEALTTEASILKICRTAIVSFGCTVGRHFCDSRVYAFFIVWLLMLAREVNMTLSLGIICLSDWQQATAKLLFFCKYFTSTVSSQFQVVMNSCACWVECVLWLLYGCHWERKKLQDLEVLNYIGMNFDGFSLCYHGHSWMLSFYVILVLLVYLPMIIWSCLCLRDWLFLMFGSLYIMW